MALDFLDPRSAGSEGLVYVGGQPTPENLKAAYAQGIFPWPQEGVPLLWFSPAQRGVVDFKDLHVGRTLRRVLLNNKFEIRWNTRFEDVMRGCATTPRKEGHGTWITEDMVHGYCGAHKQGWAHSVEVFLKGELVGGIYGVLSHNYFSAESMFYKVSSASKVALIFLILELKRAGHQWLDIQMITPVTRALGGRYIPRDEFLARIQQPKSSALEGRARPGILSSEELRWISSP